MLQWIFTLAVMTFITGALAFNSGSGKISSIAHIIFLASLAVTFMLTLLYITRKVHRGNLK